jgi:DHA1 family bicyclomycin/chloramphenicol resistance-like MFS transporter
VTATPRSGTGLIVLMAYLTGMGQLAVSLYLPSLPQIADDFLARDGTVQLTFTLFILAFAVAQLIVGPMSDHFGRVIVLKAGLVVFTLASLVCLVAPTVDILIAARVVQAIGACVAPTLSRAIVRDLYEGEKSARVLAAIGMVMAIAPAFGPTVGGFIAVGFGWRTVFGVLTALGLLSYALVYLSLDETLPAERRRKLRLGRTLGRYISLTVDRRFLAPGLVVGLGMGGLGAYLAGAPFVFIRLLDIPPYVFGMFSMLNVGSFALGSAIASRLTGRLFDVRAMTVIGAAICAAGGVLLVVSMSAGLFSVTGILAPMVVYFIGMGLALPNAMAEAINRYPDDAGLASALLGFLQFGGWAVASLAVAAWGTGSPMPLATVVCAVAVGTLAAALSIDRRTERAS